MRNFIDITVYNSINERGQSVGYEKLTASETDVLAIDFVIARITNAGFKEMFNESPRELHRAVDGLKRFGALSAANLLKDAILTSAGMADEHFDQLGDRFLELCDVDELDERIAEYVDNNESEFPGPRSLVEVWESMKARGQKEKPKRLREMERHAAEDTPFTDRLCLVCRQPVPNHKSKCRRCGRAYEVA